MLSRRIIVCLDVQAGRVVKGTSFVKLRDVGDPVALATRYEAEGADEIVFLDIAASAEERATLFDVARRTAEQLFVPLTIGGGIRSASDVGLALRAGADRIGGRAYSTQTYATRFVPGRFDGVGAVRVLRFDAACTCFRYLTGDVPVR